MPGIAIFSELPDPDHPGKTIREVNMMQRHNIPLGTLVEFHEDRWHSGGACERTIGRMFVVEHTRDCDGTPLYTLAPSPEIVSRTSFVYRIFRQLIGGFAEESLQVVTITPDVLSGRDLPRWEDHRDAFK